MKKQIKVIIIATIITACIIISCAYAMPASAESADYYTKLTIITGHVKIDTGLWVVDCRDKEGHIWCFIDDEGTWKRGDVANLLMFRLNENEENDEIMEVYWEGFVEDISTFLQVMDWR